MCIHQDILILRCVRKSVHRIRNFHKYVLSAIAILQLRTKTIDTDIKYYIDTDEVWIVPVKSA